MIICSCRAVRLGWSFFRLYFVYGILVISLLLARSGSGQITNTLTETLSANPEGYGGGSKAAGVFLLSIFPLLNTFYPFDMDGADSSLIPQQKTNLLSPASSENVVLFQWQKASSLSLCGNSVVNVIELTPEGSPSLLNIKPAKQGESGWCRSIDTLGNDGVATLWLDNIEVLDIFRSTVELVEKTSTVHGLIQSDTSTKLEGVKSFQEEKLSLCLNSQLLADAELDKNTTQVLCMGYFTGEYSGDEPDPLMVAAHDQMLVNAHDTGQAILHFNRLLRQVEWEQYLEEKRLWWQFNRHRFLESTPIKAEQSSITRAELSGLYGGYADGFSDQRVARVLRLRPSQSSQPRVDGKPGRLPSPVSPLSEEELEKIPGINVCPLSKRRPGHQLVAGVVEQQPTLCSPNSYHPDPSISAIEAQSEEDRLYVDELVRKTWAEIEKIKDFPWLKLFPYLSGIVVNIQPLSAGTYLEITADGSQKEIFEKIRASIKLESDKNGAQSSTYLVRSIQHMLAALADPQQEEEEEEKKPGMMNRAARALASSLEILPSRLNSALVLAKPSTVEELVQYCDHAHQMGFLHLNSMESVTFSNTPSVVLSAFNKIFQTDIQSYSQHTMSLGTLTAYFRNPLSSEGALVYELLRGQYMDYFHSDESELIRRLTGQLYTLWSNAKEDGTVRDELALIAIYLVEENFLSGRQVRGIVSLPGAASSAGRGASLDRSPEDVVSVRIRSLNLEGLPQLTLSNLGLIKNRVAKTKLKITANIATKARIIGGLLGLESDQLESWEDEARGRNDVMLTRVLGQYLSNAGALKPDYAPLNWKSFLKLLVDAGKIEVVKEILDFFDQM